MNIFGKKVILRAIEEGDSEMLRSMVNDPEIEKMIGGWSFPVSTKVQAEWCQRISSQADALRLIIEYDGNAVGLITLTDIDWKNRSGFTGIKLQSSCPKGVGIGTDAVMALERYAFDELQLNRLDGSWLEYNEASERLHLKCGWKIEGIRRMAVYKNGAYHDQKYVGILKEDYERVIESNHYWSIEK